MAGDFFDDYSKKCFELMKLEKYIGKKVEVIIENGDTFKGTLEYGVEPFPTFYTIETQGGKNHGNNGRRFFFKEDVVKSIKICD